MSFVRHVSPELIERLNGSVFWKNICCDTNLQPEVRNNAITVYYRGGAVLGELHMDGKSLRTKVNHKYVPLQPNPKKEVDFRFDENVGFEFQRQLYPQALGMCEAEALQSYKRLIDFEAGPEEDVRHGIVRKATNRIIDQEVGLGDQDRQFIDLCHYDRRLRCLVFVEIKQINDMRLFSRGDAAPEVISQLKKYGNRIVEREQKSEISRTYLKVIAWKDQLGLGNRLDDVPRNIPIRVCSKPVLVIGGCSQQIVDTILDGKGKWAPLRNLLPTVAEGIIACGKDGCDLTIGRGPNRLHFKGS